VSEQRRASGRQEDKLKRLRQVADKAADSLEAALDTEDTRALKDAATALKDLVAVTRDVYGIPTMEQQMSLRMARIKSRANEQAGVVEIAAGGAPR